MLSTPVAICLGAGLLLATGYAWRYRRTALARLKRRETEALVLRFGARREAQDATPPAAWHRVLREKPSAGRLTDEVRGGIFLKNEFVLLDHAGAWWHCLVTTTDTPQPPELLSTPLAESRVRQILFDSPQSYRAAFGALPERSHLIPALATLPENRT